MRDSIHIATKNMNAPIVTVARASSRFAFLPDERHRHRRRDRARQDHEARLIRREPVQVLQEDRQHEDRAEQREAQHRRDAHARRELPALAARGS